MTQGTVETTDTDLVKALILRRTAACLAHARDVVFGTGSAHFDITDGDLKLTVYIDIKSRKEKV